MYYNNPDMAFEALQANVRLILSRDLRSKSTKILYRGRAGRRNHQAKLISVNNKKKRPYIAIQFNASSVDPSKTTLPIFFRKCIVSPCCVFFVFLLLISFLHETFISKIQIFLVRGKQCIYLMVVFKLEERCKSALHVLLRKCSYHLVIPSALSRVSRAPVKIFSLRLCIWLVSEDANRFWLKWVTEGESRIYRPQMFNSSFVNLGFDHNRGNVSTDRCNKNLA